MFVSLSIFLSVGLFVCTVYNCKNNTLAYFDEISRICQKLYKEQLVKRRFSGLLCRSRFLWVSVRHFHVWINCFIILKLCICGSLPSQSTSCLLPCWSRAPDNTDIADILTSSCYRRKSKIATVFDTNNFHTVISKI